MQHRMTQPKGRSLRLLCVTAFAGVFLAAVPGSYPAFAAMPRPSDSAGLHAQIAWEAAYALSKARADGTSSRRSPHGMYESDWKSPSYPSSDQNALNQIAKRLPRSYWGNYSSAYHGGQCFFFAHDVTYRASRGRVLLPTSTSALYSGGTSDRKRWKAGDVLQRDSGSSHTAILWRVNARDSSGRATSVEVIDSNWGDTYSGPWELIHRHTLKVTSGTSYTNLGYSWRAYGPGKY